MPRNLDLVDRRRFGALCTASLLAPTVLAESKRWPAKPVRFVVAFPPGGLADVLARVLQAPLGRAFGQPVIIDNRSGASGNVAAVETLNSGGDGHTLLVTASTTESVNPVMFSRMPFDPLKDLRPVGLLANGRLFLITRPGLPVNTLQEFVAHAHANQGKLSYGSAGNGTTPHLAGELFKESAKFLATHVPYRGAMPAIQDVLSGQIDFAFAPGTALQYVKQGKLKALAVASRERAASAPALPTFVEAGIKGVYADTLFGIYAPGAMAADAVMRVNREINGLLAQEDVRARYADLGAEAVPLAAAEYGRLVREEALLFGRIVREQNIRAD